MMGMMGGGMPTGMLNAEQKKKLLWGKKAEPVEAAPVSSLPSLPCALGVVWYMLCLKLLLRRLRHLGLIGGTQLSLQTKARKKSSSSSWYWSLLSIELLPMKLGRIIPCNYF